MERISGPSTGSTSGNMLNGKTDSLTPKWENGFSRSPISAIFLPSMHSVASRAIETLQTFETSGTVREARGFASRT
ncbi:MAG: hypothetical protein BWZ10_00284 [candidate division BRC1 bacterium ADurb.BinA364]|nr:MAG: hypothetical protein BWZ10_00284 [candidate division BRC1 bacterium ADurb.BinA364]